jgi:hypothetical protein
MNSLPVVFGFRVPPVIGAGYVAGVQLDGSALIVYEDGAWWAYGVQPGFLSATGSTPLEAYYALAEGFARVLFDCATLASSFEAFQADVQRLCDQRDESEADRWNEARAAIRSGAPVPDDALGGAARFTGEAPHAVIVVRLDRVPDARMALAENLLPHLQAAA